MTHCRAVLNLTALHYIKMYESLDMVVEGEMVKNDLIQNKKVGNFVLL